MSSFSWSNYTQSISFFSRAIFSGETDNAFENYDDFVSGKRKFSFQYDRKLVLLSRRKLEVSFFIGCFFLIPEISEV